MNINIEGMLYEELLLLKSGISIPRLSVYDVEKLSSYDNDNTIIIGSNENEVTPINSIQFIKKEFLILLFLDGDDENDASIKKLFTILKTILLANPLTHVDVYIISDLYDYYRKNILSKLNASSNTDRNSYVGVTSEIFKSIVMRFFGVRVYYILYRLRNCLKN
ncbi:hypothetical protein AB8919_12040 [Yersinia enterocolitica]|uniref:hypothetical protein n=1 Tax=Yersinia enterocolitica TaxID=630 RepID=UPI00094B9821|nr:hypothetical protein [Yersinia enterocolitica]